MDYTTYFTQNTTDKITKDLIGRPLIFNNGEKLGGYIVEAEAYMGKKDRAAHSYAGRRSQANEGLYRRGGTIYIYSQRQYFFFDVACQEENEPQGVLVRAIEPIWGIDTMIKNRSGKQGVLLTNGPAKMMQAFGIHIFYQIRHLQLTLMIIIRRFPRKLLQLHVWELISQIQSGLRNLCVIMLQVIHLSLI